MTPAIPRNPCADNVRYHDNGSSSEQIRHEQMFESRRRASVRASACPPDPPPEGGRGVRVPICIDN